MPLHYETDSHLEDLAPVLDEHAEWFGKVMRWTFYPEEPLSSQPLRAPQSFLTWIEETTAIYNPELIVQLRTLHDELHAAGAALVGAAHGGSLGHSKLKGKERERIEKPSIVLMDSFLTYYDEFILQLRRLERDCVRADRGIDPLTGLRSGDVMKRDVARELERRARQGRPFCLLVVRIDLAKMLKQTYSKEEFSQVLRDVTSAIKTCIRSYDDAYHIEGGEFILTLKHSDISGTLAATKRLSIIVDERELMIRRGNVTESLTLSYGIAEPMPGDDPEELLNTLRRDLDACGDEKNAIVQYFEVSPLKMYVEKINPSDPSAKDKSA